MKDFIPFPFMPGLSLYEPIKNILGSQWDWSSIQRARHKAQRPKKRRRYR